MDSSSLKFEVIFPLIRTWMEKSSVATRAGSNRTNIGSFCLIAKGAGETQVIQLGISTVLLCDNVINLTSQIRIRFADKTVFALVVRSLLYAAAEIDGDVARHGEACIWARALANRKRCSSFKK